MLFQKEHQQSILQVLLNKYQIDPEGFRSYLPEVAQELEKSLPSRDRNSPASALTELERERLRTALLKLLNGRGLPASEAIKALEYCATLIQDETLPYEVDRKTLLKILQQAVGVPFSKLKKNTKIPVAQGEAVKEIAVLSGVSLHLTWNDRLLAVSILPAKLKRRARALKFVGIAKDTASDVSQRHNAYLAERA